MNKPGQVPQVAPIKVEYKKNKKFNSLTGNTALLQTSRANVPLSISRKPLQKTDLFPPVKTSRKIFDGMRR
jgi:hypothetical protein